MKSARERLKERSEVIVEKLGNGCWQRRRSRRIVQKWENLLSLAVVAVTGQAAPNGSGRCVRQADTQTDVNKVISTIIDSEELPSQLHFRATAAPLPPPGG